MKIADCGISSIDIVLRNGDVISSFFSLYVFFFIYAAWQFLLTQLRNAWKFMSHGFVLCKNAHCELWITNNEIDSMRERSESERDREQKLEWSNHSMETIHLWTHRFFSVHFKSVNIPTHLAHNEITLPK